MEIPVEQPQEPRLHLHETATIAIGIASGLILLGQVVVGPTATYGLAVSVLDTLLLGGYVFCRLAGGKWTGIRWRGRTVVVVEAGMLTALCLLTFLNMIALPVLKRDVFHGPSVSLLGKTAVLGSLLGLVLHELRRARERHEHPLLTLHPSQLVAVSFGVAIVLGTILLCLPEATQAGRQTSAVDALFTATSAVCVTGLIVKNTPLHWSTFGQVVILVLIQAGGLGIMTLSGLLMVALRRRFSLRYRTAMMDVLEMNEGEDVGETIWYIIKLTLLVEVAGAVALFLYWSLKPDALAVGRRAYMAVFHSISAFCNAGFSLYPDSLERYRSDPWVNLIFIVLITVGGLGFPVVRDLQQVLRARRAGIRQRLSLHSRLVLVVSAALVVSGAVLLVFTEYGGALQEDSLVSGLIPATFQSVTARTAGFNTIPIEEMTSAGLMVLVVLMFIGASPASTGGGIKTSTFAVILATNRAMLQHRDKPVIWRRALPESVRHRAVVIASLAFAMVVIATFVLCLTEEVLFLDLLFEVVSAFGTVGLSTGATPHLSIFGRLVITATMFLGRIGPLTFAVAIQPRTERAKPMFPEEDALVG